MNFLKIIYVKICYIKITVKFLLREFLVVSINEIIYRMRLYYLILNFYTVMCLCCVGLRGRIVSHRSFVELLLFTRIHVQRFVRFYFVL
jgi:hypothetical protein